MAENNMNGVVDSLIKGMETFLSSKTVVGEPTKIGDTIIVPLVDVTFGVGAGSNWSISTLLNVAITDKAARKNPGRV